jgi:hypothetical protein
MPTAPIKSRRHTVRPSAFLFFPVVRVIQGG